MQMTGRTSYKIMFNLVKIYEEYSGFGGEDKPIRMYSFELNL